jgi:GxxExxY protein
MTSPREEELAQAIVSSAYAVHKVLGPGLLESIYEACFCHELSKRGIPYRRQVIVPLFYDGLTLSEGLRLDVLVDELVICELKSVESPSPVFLAQILSQLKLARKRLGFLINFNVPMIKQGIRRVVFNVTTL